MLGGWPDPEITLTQSETNVFEFTTGFTGPVLDISYSVVLENLDSSGTSLGGAFAEVAALIR